MIDTMLEGLCFFLLVNSFISFTSAVHFVALTRAVILQRWEAQKCQKPENFLKKRKKIFFSNFFFVVVVVLAMSCMCLGLGRLFLGCYRFSGLLVPLCLFPRDLENNCLCSNESDFPKAFGIVPF